MTARANSLAAYQSLDLGRRQREVYRAILELHRQGARPCDSDLSDYLGWPVSWVVGRRFELAEAGRVERAGSKIGASRRKVAVWKPAPRQLRLFTGADS